jgi:2-oxoglutarate dehydrogenase E1 component
MQESVMQRMWESAHLSGGNAAYVEELYELYLHDPNAVPEEWRTYFQKLPTDGSGTTDVSHSTIRTHAALNRFPLEPSAASMRRSRWKCCA